jgi:hypothetical protein
MDKPFRARINLKECGIASRCTRGVPYGFFSESAFPPFNRRLGV